MLSHTIILIIITALISISAFSSERIYNDFIMYPPAVSRGQYWRLVTSGFLHADYMHLIFNMLTLYFFGRIVEVIFFNRFGSFAFILFYVLALAFSDLPTYIKHRNNTSYTSLGASGAVAAVLFSFIMLAPWETIYLFVIPIPAIVFAVLYLLYSQYAARRGGDGINHDAHIWGAVFGIVTVLVLDHEALPRFIEQLKHPYFRF